ADGARAPARAPAGAGSRHRPPCRRRSGNDRARRAWTPSARGSSAAARAAVRWWEGSPARARRTAGARAAEHASAWNHARDPEAERVDPRPILDQEYEIDPELTIGVLRRGDVLGQQRPMDLLAAPGRVVEIFGRQRV